MVDHEFVIRPEDDTSLSDQILFAILHYESDDDITPGLYDRFYLWNNYLAWRFGSFSFNTSFRTGLVLGLFLGWYLIVGIYLGALYLRHLAVAVTF